MPQRQRTHEPELRTHGDPEASAGGGNLTAQREQGEALFAAADSVIAGALSGDSLTFNQHTEQEGGQ